MIEYADAQTMIESAQQKLFGAALERDQFFVGPSLRASGMGEQVCRFAQTRRRDVDDLMPEPCGYAVLLLIAII